MADTYYPVRITRKQAGTNKKHRFYAVIPIDSDCPHESFNLVDPLLAVQEEFLRDFPNFMIPQQVLIFLKHIILIREV